MKVTKSSGYAVQIFLLNKVNNVTVKPQYEVQFGTTGGVIETTRFYDMSDLEFVLMDAAMWCEDGAGPSRGSRNVIA